MLRYLFVSFAFTTLLACTNTPAEESPETNAPEKLEDVAPINQKDELEESILDKFPMVEGSKQLVLVQSNGPGESTGTLSTYEKIEGRWTILNPGIAVNLGKAGFAPFGEKVEGDKKCPSGFYLLGPAFGYEEAIKTVAEYIQVDELHHWMSDPDSANYNQLVHYVPGTKEMEQMRRSDDLYKYGIVVQYNTSPAEPGKGSAIFLHVERGPAKPTLGCVSMPEESIKKLIEWLDPTKYPAILMGDPSYL